MGKKPPTLSVEMVKRTGNFTGTTPGEALVYRFVTDVLSGKQPEQEDLVAVAKALVPIMQHWPSTSSNKGKTHCAADDVIERDRTMREVAKRLGLKRKQGMEEATHKNWMEDAIVVAEFLLKVEQMEGEGKPPKEAEMMARSLFMGKLKIGDRAMRDRIRKHKDDALIILPILRNRVEAK